MEIVPNKALSLSESGSGSLPLAVARALAAARSESLDRVCFFVLCKRLGHWINRVPGAHQGDFLCIPFTLTLTLVMPSYLIGCPSEHRRGPGVTSYGRGLDSTALTAQDRM